MTGMLWRDDDLAMPLDAKIQKAAAYYQTKYGKVPNLCLVHPEAVGDPPAGIELRRSQYVQRNHMLICVDAAVTLQSYGSCEASTVKSVER